MDRFIIHIFSGKFTVKIFNDQLFVDAASSAFQKLLIILKSRLKKVDPLQLVHDHDVQRCIKLELRRLPFIIQVIVVIDDVFLEFMETNGTRAPDECYGVPPLRENRRAVCDHNEDG